MCREKKNTNENKWALSTVGVWFDVIHWVICLFYDYSNTTWYNTWYNSRPTRLKYAHAHSMAAIIKFVFFSCCAGSITLKQFWRRMNGTNYCCWSASLIGLIRSTTTILERKLMMNWRHFTLCTSVELSNGIWSDNWRVETSLKMQWEIF